MTKETNLTNHFLIAMPSLEDGNFSKSVTYICEHNDDGALGITINRPSSIGLAEILIQLQIETQEQQENAPIILNGGPVQVDRGFILHTPLGKWESTLKVTDKIAVTTSQDIIQAIANNTGPENSLIAFFESSIPSLLNLNAVSLTQRAIAKLITRSSLYPINASALLPL